MIKGKIRTSFLHQYNQIRSFSDNIFVADYSEQTKSSPVRRGVELFSPSPPLDIRYFSIINNPLMQIDGIVFDNNSFVFNNGNSKKQCEAVFFPSTSTLSSWILFCELKYSSNPLNNRNNLKKAVRQLYKTHYYYFQENIVTRTNSCYLIASLPIQPEPFANFSIMPPLLTKLKRTRNIVLRLKNSVDIMNYDIINA